MESILNIIFSTENVRTLVIIVSVFCGAVWVKISMKNLEHKTELSIKELEYKMEALTTRMDGSFKALTYVLEKNDTLSKEDKEYVDGHLYGQLPVAAPL